MELMKAADASHGIDDVRTIEVPKPMAKPGEIIVQVECTAVEDGEGQVLRNSLIGKFLHRSTTPLILGWNVAGVVESVGSGSQFTKGDRVWGHLDFDPFQKQGAYSEYVVMRATAVAKIPRAMEAGTAASFATTGLTALQAIRNYGGIESGNTLLVIGAGGGIGGAAVSIAKKLGADVVAVCGTKDVEKVRRLGADRVIDRNQEDFLISDVKADVILDTPSKYSFRLCSSLLNRGGTYVDLHPWSLLTGFFHALVTGKRCRFAQVQSKTADLEQLNQWFSSETTIPIAIESRFPVRKLSEALKQRKNPARSGAIVVDVKEAWQ